MNGLGKRLRELRESKNMSQVELARIFNKSQVAISKYESGSRQLDYEMLNKYSKYFNVSTDYLIGRVTQPHELYLDAHDYPEVLKALKIGEKTTIRLTTDDFSREVTTEEKRSAAENALKQISLYDCIDLIKKSGDKDLNQQFEFLISYLPSEFKDKDMSLYDFLEYIEHNSAFLDAVKNGAHYDDRGELVLEKSRDIFQKSDVDQKEKPAHEVQAKPKLRSVARLEESSITPEQDKEISHYIDFLLNEKKDGQ